MKRIVLTLALLGAAAYSYAQGTVGLGNSGYLISYEPTPGATAVALPPQNVAGTYSFSLWVAPTGTALPRLDTWANTLADLSAVGGWEQYVSTVAGSATTYGANGATSGPGRVLFGGSALNAVFPSYAPGTEVNLLMLGWNGATDAAAAATIFGASQLVTVQLGGGAFPNGSFFGTGATQSPGFTLTAVVPEPTSFALAGLGAAALLIFRRRN